ncbi:hypothetical protein GQ44DRAFT_759557 [Phaeosphaeriaceae sp. PMI808]|nr:hypothetical protein GQ44DRAFT_759557 [Phaeosphaeriaceae sp. PMI808]
MAKSRTLVISSPMDAKHVGGVNVMRGPQSSIVGGYFHKAALQPDELPSHTFVATGKVEVPKKSDSIVSTIRRPSISIRGSISRLRTKSTSPSPDRSRKPDLERRSELAIVLSENTKIHRPLKMQTSLSRLRQKVGLDKDLDNEPVPRMITPEPAVRPEPIQRDYPPLRVKNSASRFISRSASTTPEPDLVSTNHLPQLSTTQPQSFIVPRRPFHIEKPHPQAQEPTVPKAQTLPRPKRSDSGTAIDFDNVPADERPLGFQEILAVKTLADRMEHYDRARNYWAHVDHGLLEWTQGAGGPRVAAARA